MRATDAQSNQPLVPIEAFFTHVSVHLPVVTRVYSRESVYCFQTVGMKVIPHWLLFKWADLWRLLGYWSQPSAEIAISAGSPRGAARPAAKNNATAVSDRSHYGDLSDTAVSDGVLNLWN